MAAILRAFVIFLVRAMLPLSFIENEHFRDFLRVVDPRIELPSRFTLTHKLLPPILEEARQILKSQLAKVKKVPVSLLNKKNMHHFNPLICKPWTIYLYYYIQIYYLGPDSYKPFGLLSMWKQNYYSRFLVPIIGETCLVNNGYLDQREDE